MQFKPLKFDYDFFSNLTNDQKISLKKSMNELNKEPRCDEKRCLLCNKVVSRFCHSHYIPQFVLKTIGNKFYDGHSFLFSDIAGKSGIKNTLLFKNICEECDNTQFKNYEDPLKLDGVASNDLMKDIAKKNWLRFIYKRNSELIKYRNMLNKCVEKINDLAEDVSDFQKMFKFYSGIYTLFQRIETSKLDLSDFINELSNINSTSFKIIFERNLNYQTEIACQSIINLVSDLNGNLINDIYDMNPNHKMEELHICILPYNNKTKVLLFTDASNTKYDKLKKQLENHNTDWQYIINYMVLLYCEDWAISSDVKLETKEINHIKEIVSISQDLLAEREEDDRIKAACQVYRLKVNRKIYNFILKQ